METVTRQAGQDSPAVGRRNPSRCAQKNEVGTLGTSTEKVPSIQKTVAGSSQKLVDSTLQWGDMRQQQQPEEAVQAAVDTVDAVEDEDDDCISIDDWSQALLQALSFDEDLPPKFVSYRPYKGAKLRIFKLLGSLYGMSQAPTDWYKTLHGWMEQIGFIRSENNKAVWYHPRRLKVGSHVDACIARGKRKLHRWFWAEAAKRFKIKQWGFVEVEQP